MRAMIESYAGAPAADIDNALFASFALLFAFALPVRTSRRESAAVAAQVNGEPVYAAEVEAEFRADVWRPRSSPRPSGSG